jgi:hypothetical protein
VAFLDDDKFEFDVVRRDGVDVVKGHLERPMKKRKFELVEWEREPNADLEPKPEAEPKPEEDEMEEVDTKPDVEWEEYDREEGEDDDDAEPMELKQSMDDNLSPSSTTKTTTRVPKPKMLVPKFSDNEIEFLCGLGYQVKLPTLQSVTLPHDRKWYHNFHRGKNTNESREDYAISISKAFGKQSLDDFETITRDYAVNYSDGKIAVRVFRKIVPEELTEHFHRVANGFAPQMGECHTRAAQTLHLGAKEYTPNRKQQAKMGGKRIWRQDKGIGKEQTTAILPELLFADHILHQVSPSSYKLKMRVHGRYRLGNTCFTRAAVNCTNCKIHRDTCVGLDVLLYAGEWYWGGELVIPQLGIRITIQPGDVIVMDSGLFHFVTDFQGRRYVIVFFTKSHKQESAAGNVLMVPKDLSWLSKEKFREE